MTFSFLSHISAIILTQPDLHSFHVPHLLTARVVVKATPKIHLLDSYVRFGCPVHFSLFTSAIWETESQCSEFMHTAKPKGLVSDATDTIAMRCMKRHTLWKPCFFFSLCGAITVFLLRRVEGVAGNASWVGETPLSRLSNWKVYTDEQICRIINPKEMIFTRHRDLEEC